MSANGYTPIQIYHSTTASAAPTSVNLANGELAINITDGKLYYKDNGGTVQLLADNAVTTPVTSITFASTGLTPNTATSGAVTVGGTLATGNGGTGSASTTYCSLTSNVSGILPIANGGTNSSSTTYCSLTSNVSGTLPIGNGGTNITTYTTGDILYASAANTLSKLTAGTVSYVLTSGGAGVAPSWAAAASGGVTTFNGSTTGLTPNTATSGAITLGGTLAVANGGTGVTSSTGTVAVVLSTSPTLVTPLLGTPTSGILTNCTGTASGLTAGNVTTNANLTGMVTSVGNAASLGSFTSAQLATALTDETGSGANVFATSPTLVTPLLGTPTSGVATNLTGLPLTTGVTGTLPVANGGTGVTTSTGSGANALATSPTLVTPLLGTPTSGVLTNCTGLPVAGGGTGLATLTANNVILGAGTSSPTFVAPSTSGNVLTSNGTTWTSAAAAGGSAIATQDVKTTGTSATFTIPAGKTTVRITVVGGGGTGGTSATGSTGGGGGGTAIKVFTGLTPGLTLTYTVGGAGATSQVISGTQTIATISATAGAIPSGGIGSGGSLNIKGGGASIPAVELTCAGYTVYGGGGGSSTLGGGGATNYPNSTGAGTAGGAYGGGGGGAGSTGAGGAGAAGVIIFEY